MAVLAAAPQQIATRRILAAVTEGGRPIASIDPDDFVVREAGQDRDILSIRVADYPIAVLIDNGRGPDRDFDAIRRAVSRFVSRAGRRPIAIATADPPRVVATFADDRATVMDRMIRLRKGRTRDGLIPAVTAAAREASETGAAFSAVVVVTATPPEAAPADFLAPILDTGARVHIVVQQRTSRGGPRSRPQSMDALNALVDGTHGWMMTIDSADSYQAALDALAEQFASEWIVEYIVPAGAAQESDVRLGVRLAGVRVINWGVSRR